MRDKAMNEYDGHWMTTYTGKRFHFLDPKPEEIDILDIAHHLSLLCRYTGACREFYSVAEHSLRVSCIVPSELQLAALLHDGSEAYINDISRPVKYSHKLEVTERKILEAIGRKYKVDLFNPVIKEADNILLATEARDLMPNMDGWAKLPRPLDIKIVPFPDCRKIEALFLQYFRTYSERGGQLCANTIG